jgi:hypothetical protein
MCCPPLIERVDPVMKSASSATRNITPRDGVDRNMMAGAFLGQCLGKPVNAGLGCGIVDLPVLAGLTVY